MKLGTLLIGGGILGAGAWLLGKSKYDADHFVKGKSYILQFIVNNPAALLTTASQVDATAVGVGLPQLGWSPITIPVMAPMAVDSLPGIPLWSVQAMRVGESVPRDAPSGPFTIVTAT